MSTLKLNLHGLGVDLTVCKLSSTKDVDLDKDMFFLSKTDEEISLVCPTAEVPEGCIVREDGWKGFRIEGVLDFSLIGILAKIADALAKEGISIFAISTYNTDYVLVKAENYDRAIEVVNGCF